MADLSINQLASETRKAVLGAGYSFGIADDVARAVQWLAGFTVVASEELAEFVTTPRKAQPETPVIKDATSLMADRQEGQGLDLCDVMAAIDYCEGYDMRHIHLVGLRYPVLSCGLLAMRAAPPFGQFFDASGAMLSQICRSAPSELRLEVHDFVPNHPTSWPPRIVIDDGAYQVLKDFAWKTYVPSSEQSRAAGAGAGLNDND